MSKARSNCAKILVSPDKSRVELLVCSSPEGVQPTLDDCLGILYHAELKVEDEIIEAITQALTDLDSEERVLIAEGSAPEHGVDGHIEWFVDSDTDAAHTPELDTKEERTEGDQEDEAVDHYSRCAFVMVEADQEIGQVIQPTDGQDGVDAWGQAIAAKPGKSISIKHDESIITDARGVMIAQANGVLSRSREKAAVKKLLEINEYVDFSTGHLDFDGDIAIAKGVRDNFSVTATGNIEIGQLIEAAKIEAGGSIFARGGMAGRGEGYATSGGDIAIKYFDSCEIKVGGDLIIEREMIDCVAIIAGAVRSPGAALIGGTTTVIGQVEIATIGAGSGTPTEIRLGAVPALEAKLVQLQTLQTKLTEKSDKIRMELDQLQARAKNLTPTEAERKTELMFEINPIDGQLEKCATSIQQMSDKIKAISTVHLVIHRAAHPGVVLTVGDAKFELKDRVNGPMTVLRDRAGEIVYRIGDSGSNLPIKQICDFRLAA